MPARKASVSNIVPKKNKKIKMDDLEKWRVQERMGSYFFLSEK